MISRRAFLSALAALPFVPKALLSAPADAAMAITEVTADSMTFDMVPVGPPLFPVEIPLTWIELPIVTEPQEGPAAAVIHSGARQ